MTLVRTELVSVEREGAAAGLGVVTSAGDVAGAGAVLVDVSVRVTAPALLTVLREGPRSVELITVVGAVLSPTKKHNRGSVSGEPDENKLPQLANINHFPQHLMLCRKQRTKPDG